MKFAHLWKDQIRALYEVLVCVNAELVGVVTIHFMPFPLQDDGAISSLSVVLHVSAGGPVLCSPSFKGTVSPDKNKPKADRPCGIIF